MEYKRDVRLVIGCYCMMGAYGLGMGLVSVLLARMGKTFSLDYEQRGMIGTVRLGAMFLGMLAAAPVADRCGKRFLLAGSIVMQGAGLAWMGLAPHYAALLTGATVWGLGAALVIAVGALVVELYPRNPSAHLNSVNMSYCAMLVAGALSYRLVETGVPWRALLIAPAPLGILLAFLFLISRYPPPAYARQAGPTIRGNYGSAVFWIAVIFLVLTGAVESGVTHFAPNFVVDEFAQGSRSPSAMTGALALAGFAAAMLLGRAFATVMLHRVRPPALLSASAGLCALVLLGIGLAGRAWAVIVLFALAGVSQACLGPTMLGYTCQRLRTSSTMMLAVLSAAGMAGAAGAPYLTGHLGDLWGSLRWVIASLALLQVAASLIGIGRLMTDRGPHPPPDGPVANPDA